MDSQELGRLLRRPESATLEFKREFYAFDVPNGEGMKAGKRFAIQPLGVEYFNKVLYDE